MALIVETGAGLSNAESYQSVTAMNTRATNLGPRYASWLVLAASTAEAAAREATQALDGWYERRLTGYRRLTTQRLAVPRGGWYYNDGISIAVDAIPEEWLAAHFELAFRASTAQLVPDLDRGGAIKSEQVGPLSTVYMDNAPGSKTRPQITLILSRLLTPPGRFAQGPVTSLLYPRIT